MFNDDSVWKKARETALRYPWYAQLLAGLGENRQKPPLMTAGLLERHYYFHSPSPSDELVASYSTSGTSSGKRKTILYSEEDERRYIDIKTRLFGEWLSAGEPPVRKALADMGTGHAAATSLEVFGRLGLTCESLPFHLPIEQHLEKLETFRPDVLYTMPSILDRLVSAAAKPDGFGIRKIILVGEIAPPAWRRTMAARFGLRETDILDTYGSIEIGTIASYSHELGRYVIAEGLHAECVGAEELGEGFDPLPPDEKVLVLTSFVRDAFPAVRYVTCDVVRDFRPVLVNGELKQTFEAIVKRIGPELKHGEKISLYDIEEAILQHAEDAAVRVSMSGRRLTVRVRSRLLLPEKLPAVREAVENRIPEIGAMIRGGLLEGIEVRLAADEEPEQGLRGIKNRKIHYGEADKP